MFLILDIKDDTFYSLGIGRNPKAYFNNEFKWLLKVEKTLITWDFHLVNKILSSNPINKEMDGTVLRGGFKKLLMQISMWCTCYHKTKFLNKTQNRWLMAKWQRQLKTKRKKKNWWETIRYLEQERMSLPCLNRSWLWPWENKHLIGPFRKANFKEFSKL